MAVLLKLSVAIYLILLLSGCHALAARAEDQCITSSLDEIAQSPLSYDGKMFCGIVFIRSDEGVTSLVESAEATLSLDLVFILEQNGFRLPSDITQRAHEYYIEAIVEPMTQCFSAPRGGGQPGDDEECVPFRRPIYMRLTAIRPTA